MKKPLKKNALFILIISLTLIKGFFWLDLMPVLQSPDADRHLSTVMWFAEPKEITWETKQDARGTDALNLDTYNIPPEYYNFLKKYQFEEARFNSNNHQLFSENSKIGANEKSIANNNDLKHFNILPATKVEYPAPYYKIGSVFYNFFQNSPLINRIFAVEFYTFLLSLGSIYFAYKIASVLSFNKRESLLFAGILAFQPMFSFLSVSINPDSLLILGFSMFFYFALRTIKDLNVFNVSSLVLGVLIAIFSKPTGYAIIPLFGIAIIAGLVKKNCVSKKMIGAAAIFFALFFSVLTILALKLKAVPGLTQVFSTSSKFGSYSNALWKYLELHLALSEQYRIFGSYWGWFGWIDYPMSNWAYAFILFFVMLSIAGLFIYFFKQDKLKQKTEYAFLLFSVIFFHLVILLNEFTYFKDSAILYGTQGRYFLPTIIPSLILMTLGLAKLTEKKISFERLLSILLALMIFLNMYSLFSIILPAYYL